MRMKIKSLFFGFVSLSLIFLETGFAGTSIAQTSLEALARNTTIKRAEEAPLETLKVYNWDDYILPTLSEEDGISDGYDGAVTGINDRFEEYMRSQGRNVRVQYDTFSTNEDMINQLRTGKIDYDIIAPSDYAIQRMMSQNLIIPFNNESEYPGSTPNYDRYASPFLLGKLRDIQAKDVYHDGPNAVEKTGVVQDFMRGYMWGTLGLVYNPTFKKFQDNGIASSKVDEDIKDWNILWDPQYKNTAFAKDSVRDTMAAVYMNAFREEIYDLKSQFENNTLSATEYNSRLTDIFNRTEQHYLDQQISNSLRTLSENIYGYEVDNGKDDIQKGTIVGIDLAWSGDAVYAMNNADALRETDPSRPFLKYVLPEGGDNIWFDGWVMTRNALTHGVTELAQQYVDFLSSPNPESDLYDMGPAVANMDYIGYTPFIASSQVLNYLRESYDIRTPEEDVPGEDPYAVPPEGVEGTDFLRKDLNYFFTGTLEEGDTADIYYPVEDKDRQLDAMYPDESTLPRLVVMKDYGDRTSAVNEVWEAGKALQFPIWGYWTTLGIVILIASVWVALYLRKRAIRENRKERMANALLHQEPSQVSEKQRKDAQKIVEKANKQHQKEANKKNTKTDLTKV